MPVVRASTDDTDAVHGEVLINTGGVPQIPRDVIAAGAPAPHSRTVGGAIAALVSWFGISTGTNTISTTGRDAQVAGGAGSVIAGGATSVNTSGAGAVNTNGALAWPSRPAGGAFSDQMPTPWASRFVINTGTGTINGDRGAQIAGGAGSVIATGAATVKTSSAGAVNTTGALAQFSRTAAGAFSDQMLVQREFVLESSTDRARSSGIVIKAKTGSTINFGTGAQVASAGAVIADGAAAVNTNSAGAVNIYEERSSNIYCSAVVVGPTCLMIGVGLGITVCSSKKLGAGVMLAVGFSLKRKVRWWTTRLIKKIKDEL